MHANIKATIPQEHKIPNTNMMPLKRPSSNDAIRKPLY